MKKENLDFLYNTSVLSETRWVDIADELYGIAKMLEQKVKNIWNDADKIPINHSFISTYYMLMSYSIENYLKAIIIRDNKEAYKKQIVKKSELPRELKKHDLCFLAQRSGIEGITIDKSSEHRLLKRLTYCAIWYGRYPVPAKAEHFESSIGDLFSDTDIPIMQSIITKIKRKIENL